MRAISKSKPMALPISYQNNKLIFSDFVYKKKNSNQQVDKRNLHKNKLTTTASMHTNV